MNKRRGKRIAVVFAGMIILIIAVVMLYVKAVLPAVPLETVEIRATPEMIARGSYLFNYVAGCAECHSHRNEQVFAMPIEEGTMGQGGEVFDKKEGFPGAYIAKNLTPYHLGEWTDAEIFRAIVSGVSKDGHALFPIMPYQDFAKADKKDILSIIAYLRTLQPIRKDNPASHSDFPVNFLINTFPAKPSFQKIPDRDNSTAYGAYLVNMASCVTCHTQAERGKIIVGKEFSGGRELPVATGGVVRSANITPDKETGIGNWSKEYFIKRFRSFGDSAFRPAEIKEGAFNTIMPWTQFGKMSPEDLAAIYDFLRTVKPISNKVIKFSNK